MSRKINEYYVGFDMGTNSVGWAVTDTEYNLIKVKGKDFWGVREFDEALTAVDRRSKRISRRRRQREVVRIGMLKSFFDEAIKKEDELFFVRLDNSKYHSEDKDELLSDVNGIFADSDYKDADYYKDYPTIYHLRKALIEDTVPKDNKYARLVFLSLLNMYKHRGHFLDASISDKGEVGVISTLYPHMVDKIDELLTVSFPMGVETSLEEILSDRTKSKTAKSESLFALFGLEKNNKIQQTILKAICGRKVNVKDIFGIESEDKIEIDFSDASYDDKIEEVNTALGSDNFELIEIMKQIYDAGMLATILHGQSYLSFSRVDEYEKHHQDLKLLKSIYKDYFDEKEYDKMFREEVGGTYSAYVKSTNTKNKTSRRSCEGRSREDLYKTIQKQLKGIEDERVDYILSEITNETFLPKQLTRGNGVIPNQVHKMEMEAILKNAESQLSFLKEKDETGLTVSEKIVKLFAFQIPYYIGPVSEKSKENKGNGWVIRKEPGEVLPWNFEQKIDVDKTQQEFIKRLIRDCTYIHGEKVLPKASLMYEAYCVLNEINNIRIDGERISVELKQRIYNELFCSGKKVTRKQLEKYLMAQGVIESEAQVTGIDTTINNSLSSYGKFYAIFGDKLHEDKYQSISERIIELATIYGDSKKTLKNVIEREYSELLDEAQIKRILGFKFKDWGRMSRAFLELQGCNPETGEVISLIRALWETQCNMMELINDDVYGFKASLEEKKYTAEKSLAEFKAEDLDEMYFSAPVKRMVWQTICLLKEIEKIMGKAPSRVFIEMTRTNDEKNKGKRTTSREKQLIEFYHAIKGETRDWEKEISVANDDGRLRSKKMYLYYMQMGRCMYTGEEIPLDELFSNKYDIDHIYPRHYVKDDNISNNLVLVKKESNAYKSDSYPLVEMKPEVYELWRKLNSIKAGNGLKMLSDEKYKRLTDRNPFTDEQKAGFIARQLVETSQGTKGVADILKQLLPQDQTTIVYAKAGNVSDFRNGVFVNPNEENEINKKIKFLKSRLLNDFHHAKDAYLNIVVGNVYFTKFTQTPLNFIKKELAMDEKKYHYNLGKMYAWKVERGGKVAWIPGENGTIKTVAKVMDKNTPMLTRLTFEAKGAIANETLYSASKAKAENYIPLKESDKKLADVEKYGGFTSVSGAYFFLVEHDYKKDRIRTLEVVPIYKKNSIESRKDGLIRYCEEELKLQNPRIVVAKIKMQTLFQINGFKVRLSGRTGNRMILRNEVQLCLNQEWNNYIHDVEKVLQDDTGITSVNESYNIMLYDELLEKYNKGIFSKRMNPIGELLQDGRKKYTELSFIKQCKVIEQILLLSATGPNTANMTLIDGSSSAGKMLFNKKISTAKEFIMINQSVTGIYEEKVDLLKL